MYINFRQSITRNYKTVNVKPSSGHLHSFTLCTFNCRLRLIKSIELRRRSYLHSRINSLNQLSQKNKTKRTTESFLRLNPRLKNKQDRYIPRAENNIKRGVGSSFLCRYFVAPWICGQVTPKHNKSTHNVHTFNDVRNPNSHIFPLHCHAFCKGISVWTIHLVTSTNMFTASWNYRGLVG
jgi:hypothetical protein